MNKRLLLVSFFFLLITIRGNAQKVVFEGLKDINGTQLYFKVIGEGEPLLIVHGGPGLNHNYFLPHLNNLAKKYQLIFYDQRSAGQSALNVKADMNLNTFARDIEAIRVAFNIDKLNILCHSWGALPVTNYALSYPEHLGCIIYCNPAPLSNENSRTIAALAAERETPADSIEKAALRALPGFQKGDMQIVNAMMRISFREVFCDTSKVSQLDPKLPDNYLVASLSLYGLMDDMKSYNYYSSMSSVHVPVLILHGDCDITPLGMDQLLQKAIPGSQLVEFKHSGHFPFIEENKKFTKTVEAFLKSSAAH